MQDKFEDLRTFIAVVQANSFAAAARRLGVVKSAVSRRMQELENRLGAQLLNRSTRTLSLTEAGRNFYDKATVLLADLEEAESIASGGAVEPVGTLRISGPSSFGNMHLAPVVCGYLERNKRASIQLSLDDAKVDVIAQGFDLAVRIGPLHDSSFAARRLATIRRVACASPAYLKRHGTPKVPADLARHHGLTHSRWGDKEYWTFVDPATAEETAVSVGSRLHINGGEALREAAIDGCGITILPTFIIHRAVLAGALVPVLLPFERPSSSLHVIYPSRRNVSAKVRTFVDFMAARFGPTPYWDRDVHGPAA